MQGNHEKLHHGREIKKNYTMANLKFGVLQGNQEKLHHGREIKKNYIMANLKFGKNDIQSIVRDVIFLKLVYLAIYPDELFIPMYYSS